MFEKSEKSLRFFDVKLSRAPQAFAVRQTDVIQLR